QLGQGAPRRLADVPAARPEPGRVGVRQPGQHVAAAAEVVDEARVAAGLALPGLVAAEAAEGAHEQGAVVDQQRVDVPAVRHRRALPHELRLVAAGVDPPDGVVPARADVRRPVEPHDVVGVADGVVAAVAAHASGVVRQQLAGRGLLARGPQDAPQPAAAERDARGGQVVQRLGAAGGQVVEAAAPPPEPADHHVRLAEQVAPAAFSPDHRHAGDVTGGRRTARARPVGPAAPPAATLAPCPAVPTAGRPAATTTTPAATPSSSPPRRPCATPCGRPCRRPASPASRAPATASRTSRVPRPPPSGCGPPRSGPGPARSRPTPTRPSCRCASGPSRTARRSSWPCPGWPSPTRSSCSTPTTSPTRRGGR